MLDRDNLKAQYMKKKTEVSIQNIVFDIVHEEYFSNTDLCIKFKISYIRAYLIIKQLVKLGIAEEQKSGIYKIVVPFGELLEIDFRKIKISDSNQIYIPEYESSIKHPFDFISDYSDFKSIAAVIDFIFAYNKQNIDIRSFIDLDETEAQKIIISLYKLGVLDSDGNVIISLEQYKTIEHKQFMSFKELGKNIKQATNHIKTTRNIATKNIKVTDYDNMEGHDFECFCAHIMSNNGYGNVDVTVGSGDYGVDILAEKDGVKYAIQCKRSETSIGNKAIQEIFSGKSHYGCHVGVVMTNNYFTQSATETAKTNGIILWDRDKLDEMIANAI
jgi:HJR/Mrr/RecB family endonuclease/predicted transcriptional regulator